MAGDVAVFLTPILSQTPRNSPETLQISSKYRLQNVSKMSCKNTVEIMFTVFTGHQWRLSWSLIPVGRCVIRTAVSDMFTL